MTTRDVSSTATTLLTRVVLLAVAAVAAVALVGTPLRWPTALLLYSAADVVTTLSCRWRCSSPPTRARVCLLALASVVAHVPLGVLNFPAALAASVVLVPYFGVAAAIAGAPRYVVTGVDGGEWEAEADSTRAQEPSGVSGVDCRRSFFLTACLQQ